MITTEPTGPSRARTLPLPPRRGRLRRTVAAGAVVALVAGLAVTMTGGAAHAVYPDCQYPGEGSLAPGEADFDGDGRGDVAYGLPDHNAGSVGGSVIVK